MTKSSAMFHGYCEDLYRHFNSLDDEKFNEEIAEPHVAEMLASIGYRREFRKNEMDYKRREEVC